MKRISKSWVIAGVIVIGAAAWVLSGQLGAAPDGKQPAKQPAVAVSSELPAVRVIASIAMPREEVIRLFGHTAAWRKVELRSEIDGRIVELPVDRGQNVRAGDTIARIATDDRTARLREAQALLKQRQIEFEATQQLAAKGHRSETQFADAAAKLDSARAMVKRIEVEIAQTVINAPFEGILDSRPVELGTYVKAGDPIGTIVDLDPLRIVGFVIEHSVGRIQKGMPAEAVLGNGAVVRGTIATVSVVADPRTRTFKVELEVPNPDNRIVEGLTTELRIPAGETMSHKISPALLTLADDGSVGVKLVSEDGVVSFARVTVLGNSTDGAVFISGLPERATIIAVGQDYVGAGQKVRAVPMQSSETASR
jgi:membrane fusion protein, multidrug efflux system